MKSKSNLQNSVLIVHYLERKYCLKIVIMSLSFSSLSTVWRRLIKIQYDIREFGSPRKPQRSQPRFAVVSCCPFCCFTMGPRIRCLQGEQRVWARSFIQGYHERLCTPFVKVYSKAAVSNHSYGAGLMCLVLLSSPSLSQVSCSAEH